MAESAPARARCCPRAGDEPCGKIRRHDCVGPKSLRRPYGVSAGRRPALRCALRPGADRRSACAALHASSPLPASTARWGRAKPLGGDGREPRCGHILALPATGPFSVRCTTASLKRAPAGSGRSRDRLKLRPQLLGGVRMAGLERLLARCPRPDAAAISPPRSFAAFAERRRWVGPNHAKFLFTRTPARAEPKVLRGAARRPPRRFARS